MTVNEHNPPISPVAEDYLKALYSAEEWGEGGLGVTEIARRMNVAASTASENVSKLHRQGLVDHARYQKVHLSDAGRQTAIATIRRHRILETYLYEKLGFDWDEVHVEAEILEHAMSEVLVDRMDQVLGYPRRDPHGDPIPRRGQEEAPRPPMPLTDLPVETPATVTRHLVSYGVVLDATITVTQRLNYTGLTEVEVCPPTDWEPRNRPQLRPGVQPGTGSRFTLGDPAVAAISVTE